MRLEFLSDLRILDLGLQPFSKELTNKRHCKWSLWDCHRTWPPWCFFGNGCKPRIRCTHENVTQIHCSAHAPCLSGRHHISEAAILATAVETRTQILHCINQGNIVHTLPSFPPYKQCCLQWLFVYKHFWKQVGEGEECMIFMRVIYRS